MTEQESHRKEILSLKEDLRKVRDERERLFEKKKDLGKQIVSLIGEVKEKRRQRNSLTDAVKENKEKRRTLNKEIREKISKVKELNKIKKEMRGDSSVNPAKLKKDIDRMMYEIETQGVSFDKEQRIMKKIREMQDELKQFSGRSEVFEDAHKLSKEIDDLKKEADAFHEQIQTNARDSQAHHEQMITISQQIDKLKEEEKTTHADFLKMRNQYNELNKKLKVFMKTMEGNERNSGDHHDHEHEEAVAKKHKENLREQYAVLQEKIKNNAKLTTEDLIIMQQGEEAGLGDDEQIEADAAIHNQPDASSADDEALDAPAVAADESEDEEKPKKADADA